jgi:hypothetical protein
MGNICRRQRLSKEENVVRENSQHEGAATGNKAASSPTDNNVIVIGRDDDRKHLKAKVV